VTHVDSFFGLFNDVYQPSSLYEVSQKDITSQRQKVVNSKTVIQYLSEQATDLRVSIARDGVQQDGVHTHISITQHPVRCFHGHEKSTS
jgi:hypothetical protein